MFKRFWHSTGLTQTGHHICNQHQDRLIIQWYNYNKCNHIYPCRLAVPLFHIIIESSSWEVLGGDKHPCQLPCEGLSNWDGRAWWNGHGVFNAQVLCVIRVCSVGTRLAVQSWNDHTIPGSTTLSIAPIICIQLNYKFSLLTHRSQTWLSISWHPKPFNGIKQPDSKSWSSVCSVTWRCSQTVRGSWRSHRHLQYIWWRPPCKWPHCCSSTWNTIPSEIPRLWSLFPQTGQWWWHSFSWWSPISYPDNSNITVIDHCCCSRYSGAKGNLSRNCQSNFCNHNHLVITILPQRMTLPLCWIKIIWHAERSDIKES